MTSPCRAHVFYDLKGSCQIAARSCAYCNILELSEEVNDVRQLVRKPTIQSSVIVRVGNVALKQAPTTGLTSFYLNLECASTFCRNEIPVRLRGSVLHRDIVTSLGHCDGGECLCGNVHLVRCHAVELNV